MNGRSLKRAVANPASPTIVSLTHCVVDRGAAVGVRDEASSRAWRIHAGSRSICWSASRPLESCGMGLRRVMRDPWGKLAAIVGGAALVAIFGYLGVEAWRDFRTFGDVPARVEASIRGRQWVAIEGAAWRCDRLVRNIDGGVAFLPAIADDGSMVVARFDREIRCTDVVT